MRAERVQITGGNLDRSPDGEAEEDDDQGVGETADYAGCLKRHLKLYNCDLYMDIYGEGDYYIGPLDNNNCN